MADVSGAQVESTVGWNTPRGRGVLLAVTLGSGLVFLDGTSSNVALPAIGNDLGMSMSGLQWTINSYTLAITALILLGGSLGDRYGLRRMFAAGLIWFSIASILCGIAPNGASLIVARALQGVGGALVTPGSLAIIQSAFNREDRAKAIGAWSGFSGVFAALGPVAGGWLVDLWSWRLIFLSNILISLPALYIGLRCIPETRIEGIHRSLDLRGAVLAIAGLSSVTWALITAGSQGASPVVIAGVAVGSMALVFFILSQRHSSDPMMPLGIFSSRQFATANLVTVAVYGSYSVMLFLLMIQLQQVLGYSPIQAGLAAVPITGLLLVLSAPAGQFAQEIGPRIPITGGPLAIGLGLLLMLRIDENSTYLTGVFPAVIAFGLGLTITVAPLTATIVASVDQANVAVASAVNNAISRGAGLLAIAIVPGIAGITGDSYADAALFTSGFHTSMAVTAAVAIGGGVVGGLFIQNRLEGDVDACPYDSLERQFHCAVDGAPLQPSADYRQPAIISEIPTVAAER